MRQIEFHPAANLFPLIEGEDFEAFIADIKEHGLIESIILHHDGRILDGRNRYRACRRLEISPRFETWDGGTSEASYVISKNLRRRHLNESQRAMIAAKIANIQQNQRPHSPRSIDPGDNVVPITQQTAADMLNVSVPSLKRARAIQKRGDAEMIQSVERGEMSVAKAADQVRGVKPVEPNVKKRTGRRKQHENARLWSKLKEALEHINGMPDVETIAAIVPPPQRDLVTRRLPVVRNWLNDFAKEWAEKQENRNDSNHTKTEGRPGPVNGDDQADADDSNGAVGTQCAQPSSEPAAR